MKPLLALAMFLFAQWGMGSARAESEQFTIQYLYEKCTSNLTADLGYCAGYISGVAGSMQMAASALKLQEVHLNLGWCSATTVSAGQMIQAFKNWHDKNPKLWGENQTLGVIGTIQENWPCKSF
jgi:Rap1a immunity proteins